MISNNKKRKNKESFLAKYKWWFALAVIILAVVYAIIYLCFRGEGFLYVGKELEKSDWLAFLGAYLSFGGTVIVSAIAILQSHYYTTNQKKRDENERKKKLQPIFSISLGNINGPLQGIAEVLSLSDPSKNPIHQNATINIENVGEYPILHVMIFDSYRYQLLKPGEKKSIQCAYEDSPDANCKSQSLIQIWRSDYEATDDNVPKCFSIIYEDIDGHSMIQYFKLAEFDGTRYYTLTEIEEV